MFSFDPDDPSVSSTHMRSSGSCERQPVAVISQPFRCAITIRLWFYFRNLPVSPSRTFHFIYWINGKALWSCFCRKTHG